MSRIGAPIVTVYQAGKIDELEFTSDWVVRSEEWLQRLIGERTSEGLRMDSEVIWVLAVEQLVPLVPDVVSVLTRLSMWRMQQGAIVYVTGLPPEEQRVAHALGLSRYAMLIPDRSIVRTYVNNLYGQHE